MLKAKRWVLAGLAVGLLGPTGVGACGPREEPSVGPGAAETTTPPVRKEGKLRVNDQWVEVAPLVLHDGKMDLFVRCRLVQEDAKKLGHEVPPLCYDANKRVTDEIAVIRVERWLNLPIAMRYLQVEAEGTHFLVERSGSTFQMLDLVYPVRRNGEFARGEVRVVAADDKKGAAITGALRVLYPKARVEEVDMTSVKPRLGPQGKVPFAPGGPPGAGGHGHGHDHGHDHDHDHDHGHDHGHDHAHPTPAPGAPAPTPTEPKPDGGTP